MALFDGMIGRVTDRAQGAVDEALVRTEAVFAQFPDVRLTREGDTLVIEAMGLMKRVMSDVRLRFAPWRSR